MTVGAIHVCTLCRLIATQSEKLDTGAVPWQGGPLCADMYVIIRYLVRENREPLIYKVGQRLPRWCFEKAGVYWLLHVHANVEDVREQC